jgi:hypothetical protein
MLECASSIVESQRAVPQELRPQYSYLLNLVTTKVLLQCSPASCDVTSYGDGDDGGGASSCDSACSSCSCGAQLLRGSDQNAYGESGDGGAASYALCESPWHRCYASCMYYGTPTLN